MLIYGDEYHQPPLCQGCPTGQLDVIKKNDKTLIDEKGSVAQLGKTFIAIRHL